MDNKTVKQQVLELGMGILEINNWRYLGNKYKISNFIR